MIHHACSSSMKTETGMPASATYIAYRIIDHILGIQVHLDDLHIWAAVDRCVPLLGPLCIFRVHTGNGAAELEVAWVSYCTVSGAMRGHLKLWTDRIY